MRVSCSRTANEPLFIFFTFLKKFSPLSLIHFGSSIRGFRDIWAKIFRPIIHIPNYNDCCVSSMHKQRQTHSQNIAPLCHILCVTPFCFSDSYSINIVMYSCLVVMNYIDCLYFCWSFSVNPVFHLRPLHPIISQHIWTLLWFRLGVKDYAKMSHTRDIGRSYQIWYVCLGECHY